MDLFTLLGGTAALISTSLYVRFWRSDSQRTRRVLRRTKVSRIAELVDGKLACVVGTVEAAGEMLTAFMSQRPCVAYETVIESLDVTAGFARVDTERKMVAFDVVDATGRVRIEAPEAALCGKPVARGERYVERVIEPGMTVRLVGSVRMDPTNTADERGFREGGLVATIIGSKKFPLLVDIEAP